MKKDNLICNNKSMNNPKQLKKINYLIHLIISVILLVIAHFIDVAYPNDLSSQGIAAFLNIFGLILFLVSGYKLLFFKRWAQRVENARQKKINK